MDYKKEQQTWPVVKTFWESINYENNYQKYNQRRNIQTISRW